MNDQFEPGNQNGNSEIPSDPTPVGSIPPVPPVQQPDAQLVTPYQQPVQPASPAPQPPQPVMPPQPSVGQVPYQPPVQPAPVQQAPVQQAPVQQVPYQQPAQQPYQPPAPQQTPYQPPMPPMAQPYYMPPQPVKKTNGFAVASLICGIASLLMFCCTWIPMILGILAVVFGILARRGDDHMPGMAVAGLICGIIGLVLGLLFLIAYLNNVWEFNDFYTEWEREFENYAALWIR